MNVLELQHHLTQNSQKWPEIAKTPCQIPCSRESLHRLPDPRIEPENPCRIEPENIPLRLLRKERQVDDLTRQVEVEMRPVRCEQELRFGVDHLQRNLQRLEIGGLH